MSWRLGIGAVGLAALALSFHSQASDHPSSRSTEDFDAAMSYGESIGDAFAGAWTDANGSIHVLFTKDSASHGATLRGLVKDPSALQIGTARYSEQYLLEVRDAITRDEPALKQQGIEVYAVGPQPDGNKVVVRVAHADAATVALLQQRYGADLIEVKEGKSFRTMFRH